MSDATANKRLGQKKVGTVVGTPGAKTTKVRVERSIQHPVYKRFVRRGKNYIVHDENEVCGIGDKVEIVETRPLSARKRWRLKKILSKGVRS